MLDSELTSSKANLIMNMKSLGCYEMQLVIIQHKCHDSLFITSYALALINFDRADHGWGRNDEYGAASPWGWKGHGTVVLTRAGDVYNSVLHTWR